MTSKHFVYSETINKARTENRAAEDRCHNNLTTIAVFAVRLLHCLQFLTRIIKASFISFISLIIRLSAGLSYNLIRYYKHFVSISTKHWKLRTVLSRSGVQYPKVSNIKQSRSYHIGKKYVVKRLKVYKRHFKCALLPPLGNQLYKI